MTGLALGLGVVLRPTLVEWALLALAVAAVWTAEALNAAIERIGDAVSTERRELIGMAKDLGAGGVLASALGAAAVGLLVFVPRVLAGF